MGHARIKAAIRPHGRQQMRRLSSPSAKARQRAFNFAPGNLAPPRILCQRGVNGFKVAGDRRLQSQERLSPPF